MKKSSIPHLVSMFIVVFSYALFPSLTIAATKAGVVLVTKGNVRAVLRGKTRTLKRRSAFFSGDTIKTSSAARAQLRFNDHTLVTVKPNTIFRVDSYFFNKSTGEGGNLTTLMQGGLRSLTGNINKSNKDAYKIKTRVATIGIRGTDADISLPTPTKLVAIIYSGEAAISGNSGAEKTFGPGNEFSAAITIQGGPPLGVSKSEAMNAMMSGANADVGVSNEYRSAENSTSNQQGVSQNSDGNFDNSGGTVASDIDNTLADLDMDISGDSDLYDLVVFNTLSDFVSDPAPVTFGAFSTSGSFVFLNQMVGISTGGVTSPQLSVRNSASGVTGEEIATVSSGLSTQRSLTGPPGSNFISGTLPAGVSWSVWDTGVNNWQERSPPDAGATLLTGFNAFFVEAAATLPGNLPVTGAASYSNVAFAGNDSFVATVPDSAQINLNVNFSNSTFTGNILLTEPMASGVNQGFWETTATGSISTTIDPTSNTAAASLNFESFTNTGIPAGCTGAQGCFTVVGPSARVAQGFSAQMNGVFVGSQGEHIVGSLQFITNDGMESIGGVYVNTKN